MLLIKAVGRLALAVSKGLHDLVNIAQLLRVRLREDFDRTLAVHLHLVPGAVCEASVVLLKVPCTAVHNKLLTISQSD